MINKSKHELMEKLTDLIRKTPLALMWPIRYSSAVRRLVGKWSGQVVR